MDDYCVYKHTSPSGKVYIGITHLLPRDRWKNGIGYRKQQLFYRAIVKYGWENFTHEIVADNLSFSDACAMEIALITEHDSTNPNKGYNVCSGGSGAPGFVYTESLRKATSERSLKMWESPEYRRKMCEIARTKWANPEYVERHKLGMARAAQNSRFRGTRSENAKRNWANPEYREKVSRGQKIAWTDERRQAAREAMLHQVVTDDMKTKISEAKIQHSGVSVRKIDPQSGIVVQTYRAVQEAARETGISAGNITRCCKGRTQHAGGYRWEYAEVNECTISI